MHQLPTPQKTPQKLSLQLTKLLTIVHVLDFENNTHLYESCVCFVLSCIGGGCLFLAVFSFFFYCTIIVSMLCFQMTVVVDPNHLWCACLSY